MKQCNCGATFQAETGVMGRRGEVCGGAQCEASNTARRFQAAQKNQKQRIVVHSRRMAANVMNFLAAKAAAV